MCAPMATGSTPHPATSPRLPGGPRGPRTRHPQTTSRPTPAGGMGRRHHPRPRGRGARRHRRPGRRGGRQQRRQRRLRVGPVQLDVQRGQRHDGLLPGALRQQRPEGDPGRAGQRPVHADGRGQAQLVVHAELLGAGRLHVPGRDGHGHDGRLHVDPRHDHVEAAVDVLHHGRVDHVGHRLHARVVRPGRLLRRRRLPLRPRRRRHRRRHHAAHRPGRPHGPRGLRQDLLLGDPHLVHVLGRHGLQRVRERREGRLHDGHLDDRDRPVPGHLVQLPGDGDERGGRVAEVGRGDGDDGLLRVRRRWRRFAPEARGDRLLAELQQRRQGPEDLGRPLRVRHHRGGLRGRDHDAGRGHLQP
ncbi:hypothetical protein SGPA1_12192 [Streptomyces misionensis JCM 4497]